MIVAKGKRNEKMDIEMEILPTAYCGQLIADSR